MNDKESAFEMKQYGDNSIQVGSVSGNAKIEINYISETDSSNIGMCINLPFVRNAFFVEHDSVLTHIEEALKSKNIAVISGLGGAGKSQTALEYAYLHKNDYSTAIWWIEAASPETLLKNFKDLLRKFNMSDQTTSKRRDYGITIQGNAAESHFIKVELNQNEIEDFSEVQQVLQDWYSKYSKWLIIFDNVETEKEIRLWLPRSKNGHVIITTQYKKLSVGEPIDLDIWTDDEAVRFLRKRDIRFVEMDGAEALAKELQCFPLALEQAASYLIHNNETTFDAYINAFKENSKSLLSKGQPLDYENTVAGTWQITLEKLSDSAKQLLLICSFLAPDNIPISLLFCNNGELPEPLNNVATDSFTFGEPLTELLNYSLLKKTSDGLFSMHRLLQTVLRNSLDVNLKRSFIDCAVIALVDNMPKAFDDYEMLDLFSLLEPHYLSALQHLKSGFVIRKNKLMTTASDAYASLANGYRHFGKYDFALEADIKALNCSEKLYKEDSIEAPLIYFNIAEDYIKLCNYDKALEYSKKSYNLRVKTCFGHDKDFISVFLQLAEIYRYTQKYDLAIKFSQQALRGAEGLGLKNDSYMATLYNNIAKVYEEADDLQSSLECYEKALEINKNINGEEHPDVALNYHNMAALFCQTQQYDEALELYMKALQIREKCFGVDNFRTAETYNDIARVFSDQKDYKNALTWQLKDLEVCEKMLGTSHLDTAITYNGLGHIYCGLKDHEKALEWWNKALVIRREKLGEAHINTLSIYYDIANMYMSQKSFDDALKMYKVILDNCQPKSDTWRKIMPKLYNNVSTIHRVLKKPSEALHFSYLAYIAGKQSFGDEDSITKFLFEALTETFKAVNMDGVSFDEWFAKQNDLENKEEK